MTRAIPHYPGVQLADGWQPSSAIAAFPAPMSTTTPTAEADVQHYECAREGCTDERPAAELVAGVYCSHDCRDRDRGEPLLEDIEQDHRFCHSCFRKKKEIDKPPASAPDVVIGFEYLTEHADYDSSERVVHDHQEHPAYPADRIVSGAAVCECGTVEHDDDWQRAEHLTSIRDAAERLVGLLELKGREGRHDYRIDAKTLVETLTETARADGTPDWALAVGRAIIDDD